jgi:hypothetical protein
MLAAYTVFPLYSYCVFARPGACLQRVEYCISLYNFTTKLFTKLQLHTTESPMQLEQQLRKSDCVVLLVDCSRPASLAALSTRWLPLIRDSFVAANAAANSAANAAAIANAASPTAGDISIGTGKIGSAPTATATTVANNKSAIIAVSKADLLPADQAESILDHERWNAIFREFPFVACVTR